MNTKRRFLFGLFSFLFFSKKAGATSPLSKALDKETINENSAEKIIIHLKPGQKFELPKEPKKNHFYFFVTDSPELVKNPALVSSSIHKINGERNSPMVVDMDSSFTLRFLDENNGWGFSFA